MAANSAVWSHAIPDAVTQRAVDESSLVVGAAAASNGTNNSNAVTENGWRMEISGRGELWRSVVNRRLTGDQQLIADRSRLCRWDALESRNASDRAGAGFRAQRCIEKSEWQLAIV